MEQHAMGEHTIAVINECVKGAHENRLRFPDIVQSLAGVGVTGYHADFLRAETTYYGGNGESHTRPLTLPDSPIAGNFNAGAVAAAVKDSQVAGLHYDDFLARAMQAGCAGYFVYIDGQRVIYLGRQGDMHIEYFPGSPGAMAKQNI